jgi:large subunit ribosomal protein L35
MPKLKTKKAAAKRFKITATGRFKHAKANKTHFLNPSKKSAKRKMKLRKMGMVDKTNEAAVRAMLPYA